MNKCTLSMTTTIVGTLITIGSASADFQGIAVDVLDSGFAGTTHRVYANVDVGDQVNAVYGDVADPLNINSGGSGFYQNMFGSHVAPDPALFGFFPSLAYDSFVTIGRLTSADNAMLNIGIDWTDFEAGGNLATDNGTWFATPDDAQVMEVDGRVLIGQFTTNAFTTYGVVYGTINIVGKNADGTSWEYLSVDFPAPGAIALLGLAGIATRRRRT